MVVYTVYRTSSYFNESDKDLGIAYQRGVSIPFFSGIETFHAEVGNGAAKLFFTITPLMYIQVGFANGILDVCVQLDRDVRQGYYECEPIRGHVEET